MILSKTERTELQKIINGELGKTDKSSPETNILLIMSALISDFEELEIVISKIYGLFASGKEVTELLDSLAGVLSPDLINKLHFEGQQELVKSLRSLAGHAQNLKLVLSKLRNSKNSLLQ